MEWVAIASWLVVVGILSALGAPIAAAIFERFPGRGGPFALHVGLAVILLSSFWIGHLRYAWVALVGALAILVTLSAICYDRGYRPDWRAVGEGYLVFLGGFLVAVAVRVTDNTIGPAGGEQFLHFGLLNAVRRASELPPEDMWWAGESVNYYYGGHVLVDQLSRLAATEPRLAYNLGLAVVFGLATAGAYGLVGAVVDTYGYDRRFGGVLGAVLLLFAGTLTTPVRLLFAQLPDSVSTGIGWFAFEAIPSGEPREVVVAGYASFSEWTWWFERRVVHGTLVETPLFSLVKADLHGHVTTIPFMVLLIAVALAYYLTPADRRLRRWGLLLGVFPALAGMVGWMNTWSLPGAVGIAWLALAFADAHPRSLIGESTNRDIDVSKRLAWAWSESTRLIGATIGAVLVGLLGMAWIAPFVLFQLPSNDGIGVLPETSPIGPHLLLYGGYFAIFGLFLAIAVWRRYGEQEYRRHLTALGIGTVVFAVILVVLELGAFAVAVPLALLAWWLLRRRPSIGFIGVLIIGTLGLILSMELVFAEVWPPDRERLNTTYKVSMQAMVFGLLATASIVTVLLSDQIPKLRQRVTPAGIGVVATVLIIVLLLGTFPVLTLGGEFGDFIDAHPHTDASVDALSGHDRWNADQMEAISFLDERSGNPVLLEAPGEEIYTWVNPASTFTGLPSVLGWAHQRGYRGVETYYERQDQVDSIYTGSPEEAIQLLVEFEVDYIWVGEPEHDRYGDDLLEFEESPYIDVAFDNPAVTIYEVNSERYDPPSNGEGDPHPQSG